MLKRATILCVSWVIIALFLLSIIIVYNTIYQSLITSMMTVLCLGIFIFYNYNNLKI